MMPNPSSLALFLLLSALVLMVTHGHSEEDEEADVCDLPTDRSLLIYCNCDTHDVATAEEVKCNAWGTGTLKNQGVLWSAISRLSNAWFIEFNQRPERSFKAFPTPLVFAKLRKLTYFSMKSANISRLQTHAFGNSSSLSEVVMMDNMVAELEPHSLSNLKNLSKVNLGNNLLSEINRNVFVNLPNLQFLYLDRNGIQVIHDKAFRELSNLEELDLQRNNLSVIARDVFVGLKKVVRLDLQANAIEYLGPQVFADMPLLQELDLHGNQIRSISPSAFFNLKHLARLVLKDNKIVTLEPTTFIHTKMIYLLDMRNNEIETLTETLMEPIYDNLKNASMQLMLEGNRLVCNCRVLWIQKLFEETSSEYVKRSLQSVQCNLFYTSEKHQQGHVSFGSNANHEIGSPEETTTYASSEGVRNVIQLSPGELRCHEEPQKDVSSVPQSDGQGQEDGSTLSSSKKDLRQDHRKGHVYSNSLQLLPSLILLILTVLVNLF